MIRILVSILLILLPGLAVAQPSVPTNAQPRLDGGGWECLSGYRRVSEQCEKVIVPVNASMTIDGRMWRCDYGYERSDDRSECLPIPVPTNAVLQLRGSNWRCLKGFVRDGEQCNQVVAPANALLTHQGNDWRCLDGYESANGVCHADGMTLLASSARGTSSATVCPPGLRLQHGGCQRFIVPDNATYTEDGTDWYCMEGFRQSKDGCARMTGEEADRAKRIRDAEARLFENIVTMPGEVSVRLQDIATACRPVLVDGAKKVASLACDDERLLLVENGCFVTPTDQGSDKYFIGAIRCPSPRLRVFAENCALRHQGDITVRIKCPGAEFLEQ